MVGDDPVCPTGREVRAAVAQVAAALRAVGAAVDTEARLPFDSEEMLAVYLKLLGSTLLGAQAAAGGGGGGGSDEHYGTPSEDLAAMRRRRRASSRRTAAWRRRRPARRCSRTRSGRRRTSGSVALSLCTTAHPLYTRIASIFGASTSEAIMRPNPRQTRGATSSGACGQTSWTLRGRTATTC